MTILWLIVQQGQMHVYSDLLERIGMLYNVVI